MALDAPQIMMAHPLPLWLELPLALVAGFALGFLHFRSLQSISRDYLAGRSGRAITLHILRMALMGGGLLALAWTGAWPLLAGASGILAARALVMRQVRQTP